MKRAVRIAALLYPAAWRRRYGMEFDALLDAGGARWQDIFDVLKGALTMQFASWSFKTIVLTFTLIGAAAGAIGSFVTPSQYASASVIRFAARGGPILFTPDRNLASGAISVRQSAIEKSQNLQTTSITIQAVDRDPQRARALNREALRRFRQPSVLFVGARGVEKVSSMQVIDPPSLPDRAVFPRLAWVFIGLSAGLLAGLAASLALGWRIAIVRDRATEVSPIQPLTS